MRANIEVKGKSSIRTLYMKYVSQNICGMLGISLYVFADTLFISIAEGAVGITALNLVLPVYSLIYALGAMIGVGSAIRFRILRAQGDEKAEKYFFQAFFWVYLLGAVFMLIGALFPEKLVSLLGGNGEIIAVGTPYTRIFMMFGPCFMLNHVFNAFVRNDGNPSLAMIATVSSSLFNIVMDYVFMFPMKMGMAGAALATGCSPVLGVAICCIHFLSKKNTVKFQVSAPSIRCLIEACQLGTSSFVGEISSGVTTIVFNFLILKLTGNIGVAAYGVIANIAIICIAIFNGVAQGSQPLLSEFYGKRNKGSMRTVLKYGIITSLILSAIMIGIANGFTDPIIAVFNSEQSAQLAEYARSGIRIYFIGFLFAGFNIVGIGYLSATANAGWAFAASIMRGIAAIIVFAFILSALFGMTGVWMAFPAAECMTSLVTLAAIVQTTGRADRVKK